MARSKASDRRRAKKAPVKIVDAIARPTERPIRGHVNYPYDPLFFRKIDIKKDVRVEHFGRLHPRTLWRVADILTDQGKGNGRASVSEVQMLRDVVVLQLDDPNGVALYGHLERKIAFGYMSYSAIWRLPTPE